MQIIQHILVPTDFSEGAEQALALGVDFAKRTGATLHLFHVMDPLEGDHYSPLEFAPEARALHKTADASVYEMLQKSMEPYDTEGLRVELVKQRSARISSAITRYAEREKIDLIIMGSHGKSGFKRLLLGSVTAEVLRKAPCSVLTVPEKDGVKPGQIAKILVPIDLSDYSAEVLRWARDFAESYHAHLDVLHVVEPFAFPTSITGINTIYDIVPDLHAKVETRMKELLSEIGGVSVSYRLHIADGHAANTILEFAEDLASDLIILGTRGLTGAERFFIGSVSDRVARSAPCPVLATRQKADEKAEDAEDVATAAEPG